MIGVAILGSTGSIGESTLDVLSRHTDTYYVTALTAHSRVERLIEQCLTFRPNYAVVMNANDALSVQAKLREQSCKTEVLVGTEGLAAVASLPETQYVMAAIVGSAGLVPTLAAARAGKRILLANKESLVMSGRLLMEEVANHAAELLPIDSEHNAIFQCMPRGEHTNLSEIGVRKILLTASGGPFRTADHGTLSTVTPEQACAHPNWVMGRKISVDSATMMNKGLEVIEACWLFNTTSRFIQVVIHPQSVIHSMVQYVDGSVLAQLGNPDMRTPIAHALAWPHRIESGVASLDLFDVARLDFEKPDLTRFPCLRLSYEAMEVGGTAPCVLNAANEVAVANFLESKLAFLDIAKVIEKTLTQSEMHDANSIENILEADRQARELAQQYVVQCSGGYQ